METLSSPDSASDGYSPCSSPTRSNTAIVLPFLLSKARSTSPTCNTRFGSHSPFPSHELSQTNPMPSPSNFEVNGFAGAGSQIHQSTFAAEASTPAEQENRNEMSDDDNDDDAQLEQKPMNFSELSLTSQESQQDENVHTMEDLPLKDWEELQSRYEREMEAAIQHEQSIVNEVEWVMKMMDESTTASSKTESDRARKRLRTRIAFVQQSEEALAEKRKHYEGVVDAFQNAMALLGGV